MRRDLDDWSDDRTIDLNPLNYSSGRPKPREAFWGKGWPEALAYFIGLAVTFTAIHYFR